MKILIFGATGGTGRQLVKLALERGYTTSAFVRRDPLSLGALVNKVTIYRGNVLDYSAVDAAVKGQDAVLVALGVIPGSTQHILSEGTANIIRAMGSHHVKRLVVETGAAGLLDNRNLLPVMWRALSKMPPMRSMFADKRKQEQYIHESSLDWVIVRPANLTNGPLTSDYRIGEQFQMHFSSAISRTDVADFMLKQVISNQWLKKAVMLESTRQDR